MSNKLHLEIKYNTDEELNSIIQTITENNIEFTITENKKKTDGTDYVLTKTKIFFNDIKKLIFKYKKHVTITIITLISLFYSVKGCEALIEIDNQSSVPDELNISYSCYNKNRSLLSNQITLFHEKTSKIDDMEKIKKIKIKFNKDIEDFCLTTR